MAALKILGSLLLTIFVIGKCSAMSRDISNFLEGVVNAHAFSTEQKLEIQNLKNSKNGRVRLQQNCKPLSRFVNQPSGIYAIKPKNSSPLLVYCDMDNENGGWILVQRVVKGGTIPFQKTWSEYEKTFGDVNSNYWLGNSYVHNITQQERYEVKFVIEHGKDTVDVKFDSFNVEGSENNYKLRLGAPVNIHSVSDYHRELLQNDNMMFSTQDKDNDRNLYGNCAEDYGGGWWFNSCSSVIVNSQRIRWEPICSDCDSVSILIRPSTQNCVTNLKNPK